MNEMSVREGISSYLMMGSGARSVMDQGGANACPVTSDRLPIAAASSQAPGVSAASVTQAIEWLQVYTRLPCDVWEAIAQFHAHFESGVLLYLYRRLFPDEYAASQESEVVDECWSYSPREVEFLYLVAERLFPVDLDAMSEAGAQGMRMTESVSLLPYDMPWWYETLKKLSPGWQVLRLFSGSLKRAEAQRALEGMAFLPPNVWIVVLQGYECVSAASPLQLEATCTALKGGGVPFEGFAQVLALYLYKTGNPWLDTDSEVDILYEGTCWCERHVWEITASYKAAQVYKQQVDTFANWLQEDWERVLPLVERVMHLLQERAPDEHAHAQRSQGAQEVLL